MFNKKTNISVIDKFIIDDLKLKNTISKQSKLSDRALTLLKLCGKNVYYASQELNKISLSIRDTKKLPTDLFCSAEKLGVSVVLESSFDLYGGNSYKLIITSL